MKKIISIALILVLIFSVAATAAFAEKKEVLVFGTSADYAPFEFMYPDESGKLVYGGIDISVAQYIADFTGKELQVENMGFVSAKIDEQKTEETKQKVIALVGKL